MLRQDIQRDVLLHNESYGIAEHFQTIQVAGIGDHGIGQRPWLRTCCLVGLVEIVPDGRVAVEHQRIKDLGDLIHVLAHDGQGGINNVSGLL